MFILYIIIYYTVFIILYYTILYYIILYYITLYYIFMLYYITKNHLNFQCTVSVKSQEKNITNWPFRPFCSVLVRYCERSI